MEGEFDKKIQEQINALNDSVKNQIEHLTSEIEDIKANLQGERDSRIITQGNSEIAQIQNEINKIKAERLVKISQLNEDKRIFDLLKDRRKSLKKSMEQYADGILSLETDEKQYLEELNNLTNNKSFQPKSKEQMQMESDLERIRSELSTKRSTLTSTKLTLQNIEMQYNNMLSKYGISREQQLTQKSEQQKAEQQKPIQQTEQQKPEQQPIQQKSEQQNPIQQTSLQQGTIVESNNPSRLDNFKSGLQNIVKKVPIGKSEKKQTSKLKIKIGGLISTELDGENKFINMSYYTDNKDDDTKILKLFEKLGFDDKAIDSIWKELNSARGDINVVKTLLESSIDGMQAVKYLDDYLSVLKGDKKKLETFDLEYDLRDRSKFGKDEWKNFKKVALDSRNFAKVKGKTVYLLAMKIANFKPIKVISWPFKKIAKSIQGKSVERITDGNSNQQENNIKSRLVRKISLGPEVKVSEDKARQAAEAKARNSKEKTEDERTEE